MNSAFVGNEKENLQNLVDALIGEMEETVFKAGTLRATFYEDETPRFTRGKYLNKVLSETKRTIGFVPFKNVFQI